jgi:ParB/RepB/Spo0J family partition protein
MGGRSSAAPAEQLVEVKPDQVSEQEGINPRTDVGNIAELTADVKARGVLQPILVREAGTAKGEKLYTLVAGRRRLEAARKAKLATVPARVVEMTDEQAQEAALVENLQRDDLAPLEEAQALDRLRHAGGGKPRSARQLAKLINRSDDWVSDRLRLLNLPLPVAAAIDRGAIGLHAMPALARISDSGPGGQDLAEQLAKDVESGDLDARSLERPAELVRALDRLTSSSGKDPVGAVEVTAYAYNGYLLKTLPIDQEVKDELADRWNALPATHDYSDDAGQKRKIAFGPEDADAAQAYGCLLEVEYPSYNGQTSKSQYITDRVFIADRTRLWLEQQEKDAKAAKRKAAKQEKPDAGAEQAAKDAKAAAEQQRREAGAAAIARNDELAKRTLAMRVKLTPEVLALLATAAVHGYSYIVEERGLATCTRRSSSRSTTRRAPRSTRARRPPASCCGASSPTRGAARSTPRWRCARSCSRTSPTPPPPASGCTCGRCRRSSST